MPERLFHDEILLPRPLEEVFPFFAKAANLEILTPPWVRFQVLTPEPIAMEEGARIDYRIRIHGVPVRWRTEIVAWEPPHRFIDVQSSGPYKLWCHTHTFEARGDGTLCRDDVRYWPRGGALIDRLFVRRDVERIFSYRREKMQELFGRAIAC